MGHLLTLSPLAMSGQGLFSANVLALEKERDGSLMLRQCYESSSGWSDRALQEKGQAKGLEEGA